MKKILWVVIIAIVSFNLSMPVDADGPIHGVEPAQGRASGTIETICTNLVQQTFPRTLNVAIEFWNVGALGGDQYKYIKITLTSLNDNLDCHEGETGLTDIFSGGPNGYMVGSSAGFSLKLINGQAFEFTYRDNTASIPVENPQIFNGWTDEIPTAEATDTLEPSGALFSDLAGLVEINIPLPDGSYNDENWSYAKLNGQALPAGTHIRTAEGSTALLSFSDASVFSLQPESEIVLSSPSVRDGHIKLLVGVLWANIKHMAKDGRLQVEMSQAVAGIKGTIFVVEETGSISTLKVIEGTVAFTSNRDGSSIQVNSGEQVQATAEGLSALSSFDSSIYQDFGSQGVAQDAGESDKTPFNLSDALVLGALALVFLIAVSILVVIVLLVMKKRPTLH